MSIAAVTTIRPHPETDAMTGAEIREAITEAEENLKLAREGGEHEEWFAQEIRMLEAALARRNGHDPAHDRAQDPITEEPEHTVKAFPEAAWHGLFAKWRDIAAPCTEAALESLWAAFLLAVGMVIGRGAWRESPQKLYPNFYLLLIGQTGDSRKSTVLWLVCELLERIGIAFKKLAGVASVEGIYEALAERDGTKALLFNDEFRSLLAVGKRQSTQNILPRLNSLYYCPQRDSIDRVKDSTTIVDPFVSMIAATPRAYVDDLLSELEIRGGFLNRFLIVSGEEQAPKPIVKAPSAAAWESVAAPLRAILTQLEASPRHLEMTPQAEEIWCEFYNAWKTERRSWQQRQAELTARIFEHVLKIAIVYTVLAQEDEISADSICRAVAVGGWLQSNTLALFSDVGLDALSKVERVIVEILKSKGRMYRRDLQQVASKRGFNAEFFNRALKSLEANDVVEIAEVFSAAGRRRFTVELLPQQGTGNT
jgi:hypothetical protein